MPLRLGTAGSSPAANKLKIGTVSVVRICLGDAQIWPDSVILSPTLWYPSFAGATTTINITCATAWTVEAPAGVTLSASSGTGSGSITATVGYTGVGWSGYIVVSDGTTNARFYVSQAGGSPGIAFGPTSWTGIIAAGHSSLFYVTSSGPWSLDLPAWITASTTTGGNGVTELTITASANTGAARSGDITATVAGVQAVCSCSQLTGITDTGSASPATETQKYTGATSAKSSVITSSAGWYATCDASLLIGTAAPPTGTRCPASGTLASGESVFYKRNGTSQTLNSVGNVYIWVGSTNVCTIAVTFVA